MEVFRKSPESQRMNDTEYPFETLAVKSAFAAFPEYERNALMSIRELIFTTAKKTKGVGRLFETLKWNQPAYLTPDTMAGSTIRLGVPKTGGFAIYAYCQTTIISDFKSIFPDQFDYDGNRAIHFRSKKALPMVPLEMLIRSALTYHL